MKRNFWKKIKHSMQDSSGSITVEFVIWFPVLMFWLLGTIVFFDFFKARSNLSTANATIADIISRNSEVTDDYITLLHNTQTAMLPRTSGNGLRISSIQFTIDPAIPAHTGDYTVEWSAIRGGALDVLVDADIDVASLPNMYDGETLLFVESSVPFVPLTSYLGITFRTLRNEIAISPRYESRVVWVNP
ncbi:MAG: pilus assembly protein [Rhodobacteraceae bacterium]|nr:pilus assembly protein [Paracoccaceae bacterium]